MMRTLTKRLQTLAASALLLGAVCAPNAANAGATFQVSPASLGGNSVLFAPFWADAMNGSSSARITHDATPGYFYTGLGYIQYTSMTLNNSALMPGDTGLGVTYSLYATFEQHFACATALAPGVTCGVTSIDLKLIADLKGVGDNFNTYNQATPTTGPSVSTAGAQIKLADVNVVNAGVAGLNVLGGAFQNINSNFLTTAAGDLFFTDPAPFYDMAFSAFNNTSLGIQCGVGGCSQIVSINSESGITDFIGTTVPEPGPLSLLGIGILGFALSRRKSRV